MFQKERPADVIITRGCIKTEVEAKHNDGRNKSKEQTERHDEWLFHRSSSVQGAYLDESKVFQIGDLESLNERFWEYLSTNRCMHTSVYSSFSASINSSKSPSRTLSTCDVSIFVR